MTTTPGRLSSPLARALALAGSVLLGFVLVTRCFAADEPAEPPGPQVSAIWKSQEISFFFQSFTTFYSCSSLESRVRQLLIELGADKDVQVRTTSCFGNEIARLPHLRITVSSPVEATPEALAELEKTRTTRELTARVRGEPMVDPTDQFPAYWKPVSLSRGSLRLEPGDCELIDQLKRNVLPKLSIRIVKDGMSCSPNQNSLGQPRLEVEALTAAPKPDDKEAPDDDVAPAKREFP